MACGCCCGRFIVFGIFLSGIIFAATFIYGTSLNRSFSSLDTPSVCMKIVSPNKHVTELRIGYPEIRLRFRIDYNSNDILLSKSLLSKSMSLKTVRADSRLAHRGMKFDDIIQHRNVGHQYGIELFHIEQFRFELGVFYVDDLYIQNTDENLMERSEFIREERVDGILGLGKYSPIWSIWQTAIIRKNEIVFGDGIDLLISRNHLSATYQVHHHRENASLQLPNNEIDTIVGTCENSDIESTIGGATLVDGIGFSAEIADKIAVVLINLNNFNSYYPIDVFNYKQQFWNIGCRTRNNATHAMCLDIHHRSFNYRDSDEYISTAKSFTDYTYRTAQSSNKISLHLFGVQTHVEPTNGGKPIDRDVILIGRDILETHNILLNWTSATTPVTIMTSHSVYAENHIIRYVLLFIVLLAITWILLSMLSDHLRPGIDAIAFDMMHGYVLFVCLIITTLLAFGYRINLYILHMTGNEHASDIFYISSNLSMLVAITCNIITLVSRILVTFGELDTFPPALKLLFQIKRRPPDNVRSREVTKFFYASIGIEQLNVITIIGYTTVWLSVEYEIVNDHISTLIACGILAIAHTLFMSKFTREGANSIVYCMLVTMWSYINFALAIVIYALELRIHTSFLDMIFMVNAFSLFVVFLPATYFYAYSQFIKPYRHPYDADITKVPDILEFIYR